MCTEKREQKRKRWVSSEIYRRIRQDQTSAMGVNKNGEYVLIHVMEKCQGGSSAGTWAKFLSVQSGGDHVYDHYNAFLTTGIWVERFRRHIDKIVNNTS